jgi:hypothetical protein
MTLFTTHRSALALVVLAACSPMAPQSPPQGHPDSLILGRFEDDYGSLFTITRELWTQHPRARYHIVRWRSDAQFIIARNDSSNPSDGGLWTRIDWMALPGLPPYTWAFCMSAYQARSAAAGESTRVARRDTPRSGCNGHPFSRMKPLP